MTVTVKVRQRQTRRRRRLLGSLSGLLAVAALAGTMSANTDALWAAASIGVLVVVYLALLARFRPGGASRAGPPADVPTEEWISPYLLDRWAVTRFLWAGLAGCVFKLLVTLAERLERDGLPSGGFRGALLERGLRLHGHLADRALRSLAVSATAAAGVTAGSALLAAQAASASSPTSVPAAASAAAGTDPSPITYQVVPGDTLSGIAERFGTTVSALAAANSIADPNLILAGQTLTIAPPPTYQVVPGDTLSGIAARFGTTVSALVAANGIADPNLILVGQTLTMVGPNGDLSPMQIADLVASVGFQGSSIWEFTAIALAESGGNPIAVSPLTPIGTHDFGLFQIDTINLGHVPSGNWPNPIANAQAAFSISGGGANPFAWCTWPGGCSGTASQFFSVAQAVAAPFEAGNL